MAAREMQRHKLVWQPRSAICAGIPLLNLETELHISGLVVRFRDCGKLNAVESGPVPEVEKISTCIAYYYNAVAVPGTQFQGHSKIVHKVR